MAKLVLLGEGFPRTGWKPVEALLSGIGHTCTTCSRHEDLPDAVSLGLVINYNRIIPRESIKRAKLGFVLFHASNLPDGRGWAPIYHTIAENKPLVVSQLFVAEEVDAGNLIAKGTYRLEGNETEAEVRQIAARVSMRMLHLTLSELLSGGVKGISQDHVNATWNTRRRPEDSWIEANSKITDVMDHLRALPNSAPAFFDYRGRRFFVKIETKEELDPVLDEDRLLIKVTL